MKKYICFLVMGACAELTPIESSQDESPVLLGLVTSYDSSLVCNFPFGTHCTPQSNCSAVCSPDFGYCPEYSIDELNYCRFDANDFPCGSPQYRFPPGCLSTTGGCVPASHYCFPGSPP
jgi:hypothetical protein